MTAVNEAPAPGVPLVALLAGALVLGALLTAWPIADGGRLACTAAPDELTGLSQSGLWFNDTTDVD